MHGVFNFQFMKMLESSGVKSANPYPAMRWNSKKTYLFELEKEGIAIPDCSKIITQNSDWKRDLIDYFKEFEINEAVVKPIIGTDGQQTYK